MIIDNTPAIRAFALERLGQLQNLDPHPEILSRIDELQMIIALCEGLLTQSKLFLEFSSAPTPKE